MVKELVCLACGQGKFKISELFVLKENLLGNQTYHFLNVHFDKLLIQFLLLHKKQCQTLLTAVH